MGVSGRIGSIGNVMRNGPDIKEFIDEFPIYGSAVLDAVMLGYLTFNQ